MKKVLMLFIFLLSVIIVQAQTADKKWGLGLGAGIYGNLEDNSQGFMPELYLSRYLSPSFDVMAQGDFGLFNSKVSSDLDLSDFLLNLRYKLYNGKLISESSVIKPYLYAGGGYLIDNGQNGFNYDAGLGSKFSITPNTALFVEGGYISGLEYEESPGNNVREDLWKVIGGIEFSFGKSKDSDGDGVSDRKDNCPDTPMGVVVDEDGCPIDTDGDGVADYIDDCPTEAGLISLNGCPDSDGDGVADKDDDCPDVKGLKQFNGCPDTDGDGVPDNKDKCPDTPSGYKVDANGCPIDSDGDGLVDEEDDCPTEAGPILNKGCPEKIMEFDDIYFDFDKSILKPAAIAKLDILIKEMKEDMDMAIDLSGHADEKGTEAYNMVLSEKRAKAARKYLVDNGIAPERLVNVAWYGKSKPVASNATDEGRALNRRVEFEVSK